MTLILVVDDEALYQHLLKVNLEKEGYEVMTAGNGEDALEIISGRQPDLAILDISMPKLNGIDVIRRLSKELEHSRILVLTMHAEEEYVLHVVRAGASGFLLKDSASAELIDAVRSLANGRGYFGAHASRVMAQQVK